MQYAGVVEFVGSIETASPNNVSISENPPTERKETAVRKIEPPIMMKVWSVSESKEDTQMRFQWDLNSHLNNHEGKTIQF